MEKLLSKCVATGRAEYTSGSFWIRQPRVYTGWREKTVALVFSDGPDPTKSDVVLQTFDVKTKKTKRIGLAENAPLGHQDPVWRPDGKQLLYVKNGRDGTRGAPVIWRYDPVTKKNAALSSSGYMQPSWSPDGRWIAVTKTSSLGTDVAILDARSGSEVLRLTSDGRSWAPVWSPKGDSIVYMHIEGLIVDLKMIGLSGAGPTWKADPMPDVTQYSGLDGGSAATLVHPGVPAADAGRLGPGRQPRRLDGSVTAGYLERLAARSAATGTVLCLGLDPDPDDLPVGFAPGIRGVEAFCRLLVETCLPVAAAVKANLAFFEAFGPDGIAALERIRAAVPADVPFIADAKRGDIGSTAARQAVALFDRLGADAITASPYLGAEAIEPLLERADRFTYVLCRTSNPGAGELQDLAVEAGPDGAPAERLYERVARLAAGWGPGGTVGLVVGATAPAEMARIRDVAPGRHSWSPASGPRAVPWSRSSATARRPLRRPGREQAGACW